ncbi:DUF5802 family protein [Haladaptatus sp. GCM10025707]|uniref:DUF5802 family protein n=1 Tax=Haladaptatus sp. GCM10025707 TaxID=3252658 RepID=UPI003614E6DF
MYQMFERFSSGYYVGQLYVEPYDGDVALMHQSQHERVNEQVYATAGVARADYPLVMKLGHCHFSVHADAGVPEYSLFVPESLNRAVGLENPPERREVWLARANRAQQLLRIAGAVA